MELDSVQISVERLGPAALDYEIILGFPAYAHEGVVRFQLERGAVELKQGEPGERLLRFVSPTIQQPQLESYFGVAVRIDPHPHTPEPVVRSENAALAIDHVVIQTIDPERAISLWRDTHGLRLAFDKEFPERGLRLLFFRSAAITLEYAAPYPPAPSSEPDRFHGISYRVPSIERAQSRLRAVGVEVSEVREGHRPNSSVCTVRSGTCGVPTLLIEVHGDK